jgi:hypothetical protein
MSGSVLARGLLALLGGLALFLADYPIMQPWLVLLAFAPLALGRPGRRSTSPVEVNPCRGCRACYCGGAERCTRTDHERTLRVAAVGRGRDGIASRAEAFVAEAATQRAKRIVFPEVAFTMASGARSEFESHWSAIARENAIFIVVPYVVRAAERGLRNLGCPKVNLQARAMNSEAVAFYRSVGYVNEERLSMGRRLDAEATLA